MSAAAATGGSATLCFAVSHRQLSHLRFVFAALLHAFIQTSLVSKVKLVQSM